ncbi:MAG: hypothetical protein NTY65_02115 [Planctomycetota bacterium]|nr:hypothetical protein [Planctomycetota bacterium]
MRTYTVAAWLALSSFLLPLGTSGCTQASRTDAFEEACAIIRDMPLGTEVREIESQLHLPKPNKTYMGSGLYHFRVFRYVRDDGLFLEIGLRQASDDQDYDNGRFEYVGHHTIATKDRIWKRWVYEDGLIEYRGPRKDTGC